MSRYEYNSKLGLFTGAQSLDVFLAVNWNITGECINNCTYCFGKDISEFRSQSKDMLYKYATHLAGLSPDLVVLTGGEPMLCDYLLDIVEFLIDYTNVIIDTSGVLLNEKVLSFFAKKNIHLRISLDSTNPIINESIRPSRIHDSTNIIKHNIELSLLLQVPLTVQTTISTKNIDQLFFFAEWLKRVGIGQWRLNLVIPHSDSLKNDASIIANELKEIYPNIYIRTSNMTPSKTNHMVLLDPLGNYWVRGEHNNHKKRIGTVYDNLTKSDILMHLDTKMHCDRYWYL